MPNKRDTSYFNVIDWNFSKEDSRHFLHNFCWYPSRFIPIIPAHLIQALSKENETILDPFCGVGTSIIEALKLGRNAIGVDINPVGTFIAETKARIMTGKVLHISKMTEFNGYVESKSSESQDTDGILFSKSLTRTSLKDKQIRSLDDNSEWYHPVTLQMLSDIHEYIESKLSGLTKDICRIFFISILMHSSGYPKEKNYAYYADNVKPKGEKTLKNAYRLYHHKLNKFITDYRSFKEQGFFENSYHIFRDDAKNLSSLVQDKVDLIVTSPPYLNVTDYTTAFRLAYLWYDFLNEEELKDVKKREIGARWKRKQQSQISDYIEGMEIVLTEMSACLRKNKYLCLILGESKKYSENVNAKIIEILTKKLNHELVDNFTRDISKKFFVHPNGGGVQTEEILIFRKRG
ncbi:MAG: site-specific DNA-methyltransferase [Thermodesulfovibrionales bacterium]|nr:site-specific DNA-methyltransferase [Thermodesulfovibrionales bacterium]